MADEWYMDKFTIYKIYIYILHINGKLIYTIYGEIYYDMWVIWYLMRICNGLDSDLATMDYYNGKSYKYDYLWDI